MSCLLAFHWGLLLPTGLLLFSLSVVMAGILIGARYSLYVTCIIVIVMAGLQYGKVSGKLHPDLSWVGTGPTVGDVIGFSAILFVIALVSWLFNRQMELSLKRAQRSEKALQRQRDLLEIKVEKRARQLEQAQLEKMQQLYRFAELGQLSTALFHDLANHLSTVNLDIEGLSGGLQPDIMRRIQQNVGHINDIVRRVRQQIGGKSNEEAFDVQSEIEETITILEPRAEQAGVLITTAVDKSVKPLLSYKGDVTRFRQVILNLVGNGIEAYPNRPPKKAGSRVVNIALKRQGATLLIAINDHGAGIRPTNRGKIFDPFYTTKPKGIGIGLFIVKQIIVNDFNGSIELTGDKSQGTTFTVSLSKTYYVKTSRR
jgi:signal transduction histidine kinase